MAKFTRFDPRNKKQQKTSTKSNGEHRHKVKYCEEDDNIPKGLLSKFVVERYNNGDRSARK